MKIENKITLDYVMLLILLSLMMLPFTGIIIHEILGLIFFILTLIHILNNKNWIKNIFKSKFIKDMSLKKALTFFVNSLLFILFIITIASGIMVSVVLFRFINIQYKEMFYQIHIISSYGLFILSIVHLFMHIKMIKALFRKKSSAR